MEVRSYHANLVEGSRFKGSESWWRGMAEGLSGFSEQLRSLRVARLKVQTLLSWTLCHYAIEKNSPLNQDCLRVQWEPLANKPSTGTVILKYSTKKSEIQNHGEPNAPGFQTTS